MVFGAKLTVEYSCPLLQISKEPLNNIPHTKSPNIDILDQASPEPIYTMDLYQLLP
jgi:hypothetical protein